MKTIYLIHGFATGPSIWREQITLLSPQYQIVLDQEQIIANANLYIIGWSMGGLKALDLLFEHHQKIGGVILVSAFAKYVKSTDYPHGQPLKLLERLERRFLDNYQEGLRYFYDLIFPAARKPCMAEHLPQPTAEDLQHWFAKLRREDKRAWLPKVEVPVLIVQGDKDPIVSKESGEYLHSQIPHSRLEMFAGMGHAPFLEAPDRFSALVEKFIG